MKCVLVTALVLLAVVAGMGADLPDDVALDKTVTLAVKGEALADIMLALEKQTGVRLRASKDIAEQKATVFVDDKPLREVMAGLSATFGYYWAANDYSTGRIYEIWQDEKLRKELSNQRDKAVVAAWKASLQEIEFIASAVRMSALELEQSKADLRGKDTAESRARLSALTRLEKNPLIGYCASLIAGLPDSFRALTKPGVSVRFDARSGEPEWTVPPSLRTAMVESLKDSPGEIKVLTSLPAAENETTEPDPESVAVNIVVRVQGRTLNVSATVLASGSGHGLMPYARPVQLSRRVLSEGIIPRSLPRTGNVSALEAKAGITTADLVAETESYPPDARTGLLNKSDVLEVLHRKTGIQVIADHYSYWNRWTISEDSSPMDILNAMSSDDPSAVIFVQTADWGWDGKYLYIRARDVYSADLAEIPNASLKPWVAAYKETGCLGLDECADIAALNEHQASTLTQFGPYLELGRRLPSAQSAALRLFGTLSQSQRRAALSGATVVDAFSPEQRAALAQVFFRPANFFTISTQPTGDAQVGIWTTAPPSVRLDRPQEAPEMETNPEPPVTAAVKEGSPQGIPPGLRPNLPPGGSVALENAQTAQGPGSGSVVRTFSSLDGVPYTMVFTYADGSTREFGFSVPKCGPKDQTPVGDSR